MSLEELFGEEGGRKKPYGLGTRLRPKIERLLDVYLRSYASSTRPEQYLCEPSPPSD